MYKIVLMMYLGIFSLYAQSQTSVNLKVRVSNPVNSLKIKPLNTFTTEVVVSNLGPDNFNANDSFALFLVEDYQGKKDTVWFYFNGNFINFKPFLGKFLQVGDSTKLSLLNAFDTSFAGKTVSHCVSVQPLNRQTNSVKDTMLNNNTSCISIEVENLSAVNKIKLKDILVSVFPNPASDYFKIISTEVVESVWVHDIQGREMKNDYNDNIINCQTWPEGVYIIKIKSKSGFYWIRLLKF